MIFDLSGGYIAYQLREGNRVPWALLAGFSHNRIIARLATEGSQP
jgi:hypothetical protein